METWEDFKTMIQAWIRNEITEDVFYDYVKNSDFEKPVDKALADLFVAQEYKGKDGKR